MAAGGVLKIGSKEPVPPGKHYGEIRVLFPELVGVMNAMHVGSDQKTAEEIVGPAGKSHVGVREDGQHDFGQLEADHGDGRRGGDGDYRKVDSMRDQNFQGMKAKAGGPVEIGVRMVDLMDAPQERNGVVGVMLTPSGRGRRAEWRAGSEPRMEGSGD